MQVFETSPRADAVRAANTAETNGATVPDFGLAEREFTRLVELADLDARVASDSTLAENFERALASALVVAYGEEESAEANAARLFTQRVLYRVNRLKLFWYDDLSRYDNERSDYLRSVRDHVEAAWQNWELAQLDASSLDRRMNVEEELRRRAVEDVAPPLSEPGRYFRERAGLAGYRRLLAIFSLDGLVEASQLSRVLGGAANEVQAMITRVFVEEYGGGRLNRKHSTFFAEMLAEFDMNAEPEGYFDLVPWEVLAAINHSFLLSERKRFYLRYVGGLMNTEISVPASFTNYHLASQRLGLSEKAGGYWELHVREDERHGRWMLDDVSLPLAAMYPRDAWEIVLGYDQQKLISDRAGAALAREAQKADAEAANEHGAAREAAA